MTDAPPIPADADLRHMPSYMIDVKSLLDSDLAAFGDPAANWYAVLSWCASLHQIPAGSLPDDDAKLAYLVRLGRDVRTWRRFREKGALRGWILHSDGRLYHPVVTEKVLDLLHVSRAGKAGGLASGAVRAARKNGQTIDNTTSGPNDRSNSASSKTEKTLKQNGNNRREGNRTEGKGLEDGLAAGQGQSQDLALPSGQAPVRKKRQIQSRTAINPEYTLAEEDRRYARDRGWSELVIDQQLEKFKNFHTSKGNLMASWAAAWRTWVGNGYDFKGGRPTSPAPSRADSAIDGIASRIREDDFT